MQKPQTQLDGQELLSAMGKCPNTWFLTTESMYKKMIRTKFIATSGLSFLTSEPSIINKYGYKTYPCFAFSHNNYYATYMTRGEFNLKTRPFQLGI
jgi:hypothetical protein